MQDQEQFTAPVEDSMHPGVGSSYVMPDKWLWIQIEIHDLRAEKTRQGVEQTRQGTLMDEMHALMQRLMLQFPPPQ